MQLSVIITIVEGGTALEECLHSLDCQAAPPEMEVIVPFDSTIPAVARLADRFPGVRFLNMGTVVTERPAASAAGQHELFDRRRSVGLAAARGAIIAILEDRGIPRRDWAQAAVAAHSALPNPVVGGAVENGVDHPTNWAVYFCDFGRYQLPLQRGPATYATDVNITYKRAALERTREIWADRYHETTVHWALQRDGDELFLAPEMIVEQVRRELGVGRLLRERYHWGRLFAYTRAREANFPARMARAALAPLLPPVLFARLLRGRLDRRAHLGRFVLSSPLVLLLLCVWSLGEFVGYVSGRP